MPLTKFQFRPGVNRETTTYTNEGGWFDIDKVRFRFGFPENIGGWLKSSATYFLGTCRALHPWVALDGSSYLGVGTHLKYYINEGGAYNDITPIRLTTSAGDVTFDASANTLSAGISIIEDIIPLTSSTGFPDSGRIKIDSEIITYASVSGNNLIGCSRGQNGTTAATHSSAAAVTCATLLVTCVGHGALDNDFVTFSGATTLGDAITADILNQEYQVTALVSTSVFQVEARTVSTISSITGTDGLNPTYVFATTSDSGNGGASVIGVFQINTGLDTTIIGTGWGAGTWGRDTWGSGASITTAGQQLRIWSHDNFGEDLLFNVRNGGIYYWDKSSGTTARGVALSSLASANTTPTIAKQILVSDRDRHIIAFGCDSQTDPGIQDPLLIRFSTQESLTDWAATATNTAGDLRIGSGSEIITAVETRQQVLVFTDKSLYAMQYLGPPFTFGISAISENITIQSPLAAIAVEDNVFWMGQKEFYVYGGAVQRIPCTVRDYVFSDFNSDQGEKVTAATNTAFSEVWWFYPSANSEENDRYVVYNYQQQIWYYGLMSRTCWVDRGINEYPIAASPDHVLYLQELGFNDGSTVPETPLVTSITSSPIDIQDGEQFAFITRLFPDLRLRPESGAGAAADFTIRVRNSTSEAFAKEVIVPYTGDDQQVQVRLRGRQFSVKIDSNSLDTAWRLGSPRLEIQPDGRR
jgi:hypothetical protein